MRGKTSSMCAYSAEHPTGSWVARVHPLPAARREATYIAHETAKVDPRLLSRRRSTVTSRPLREVVRHQAVRGGGRPKFALLRHGPDERACPARDQNSPSVRFLRSAGPDQERSPARCFPRGIGGPADAFPAALPGAGDARNRADARGIRFQSSRALERTPKASLRPLMRRASPRSLPGTLPAGTR
jgi:hypothetical protein